MDVISQNDLVRIMSRNAREHDIPITGCFELTPLCNLDCKMCYIHLDDPSVRSRILSGDEWIDLMDQAIKNGMINALLTGGEALVHPDFWKIYFHLIDRGISARLKTNGILLDKNTIEKLVEYPPAIVDISLYGCDPESYLAVTEHDVFEKVTENIKRAIEARLFVRLMVVPSAYMLPWVDRIMEYAKSLGAHEVKVNGALIEANKETGRSIEDFGISLEEHARIFRKSLEMFPFASKTQTEEEAELMGDIPKDEPHILPSGLYCNAGRTTFAMNWDGTMGPCLDFPREIICADAKHIGFKQAWHEVNRGVKDYIIPKDCHTCSHNTKCHYCPTQHKHLAARHLCESAACEWRMMQSDIVAEHLGR